MILIGDVLFFKKTDSLISKVIAKFTSSEYTHVGLIVAFDELTNVATIIESERFVRTRINRVQLTDRHVVYSTGNLTEEKRNLILKYAYSSLGAKYDYSLILGIIVSLVFKGSRDYFNNANRFICSEFIDIAYYKTGVKRKDDVNIGNVTPQELLEEYDFKEIRKGV
jgi:hypothetical protein